MSNQSSIIFQSSAAQFAFVPSLASNSCSWVTVVKPDMTFCCCSSSFKTFELRYAFHLGVFVKSDSFRYCSLLFRLESAARTFLINAIQLFLSVELQTHWIFLYVKISEDQLSATTNHVRVDIQCFVFLSYYRVNFQLLNCNLYCMQVHFKTLNYTY